MRPSPFPWVVWQRDCAFSFRLILLVVLRLFGQTTQAASLTLSNTADRVHAHPGDGACQTATDNRQCKLRPAIQETNPRAGSDTAQLPAALGSAWDTCKSALGPWRVSRGSGLALAPLGLYFDRQGVPRLYRRSVADALHRTAVLVTRSMVVWKDEVVSHYPDWALRGSLCRSRCERRPAHSNEGRRWAFRPAQPYGKACDDIFDWEGEHR
jgi:hypothetical protein